MSFPSEDTIATIEALSAMGEPARKIRVVFNKLEADETVEEVFYPLFAYQEDTGAFTLDPKAVIHFSELYQKFRFHKTTIGELLADRRREALPVWITGPTPALLVAWPW